MRSDAPLYEQSARNAVKAYFSGPRARPLSYLVFRVVAEGPEFVEVETNPDVGQHCYQPPGEMRAVALRAFVRRSDLAPITTRETTIPLTDGASVVLGTGLVAMPAAAGVLRVDAEDWSLLLAVPHTAVGVMYEPRALPALASANEVTTPGAFRVAGQPLFKLSYPLPAYEVTRRAKDVLATLVVRCAQLRLSLSRDRVKAPDDQVLGGLVAPVSDGVTIRAGAPVYWRDGAPAGSMRSSFTFRPSSVSSPGKRCGLMGEMPICFNLQDVSRHP
jgi:hypothetical protein